MIPKIIHYCWFGGNPMPELAHKCIASWKKYCPDYEIKEWNETNFDIHCCRYVKEAYEAKKWAFVSDYARFWILYHEGGLYFDTDVEIIASLDDLVEKGNFMGCESVFDNEKQENAANPGLGLAANSGLGLYREILDFYEKKSFHKKDGSLDMTTVVKYTTDILVKHGFKKQSDVVNIDGIYIYPPEYFCPKNYLTGELGITPNTRTIHHYTASWHTKEDECIRKIAMFCINVFGEKCGYRVARVLDFPFRVKNKVNSIGMKGSIKFVCNKLLRGK